LRSGLKRGGAHPKLVARRTARKAAAARAIGGSPEAFDRSVALDLGLGVWGRKETSREMGMSCTAGTCEGRRGAAGAEGAEQPRLRLG
jgi:hypothetical protein